MNAGVAIVGSGHAGVQAAASLRQSGYDGPVVLIGEEAALPYHRPPLSKAMLTSVDARPQQHLRGDGFFEDNRIDLRLGKPVESINPTSKTIELAGATVPYDSLILATGCKARRLPGYDFENVHTLRSLDDAQSLKAALKTSQSLAVIGGGFIGLEVAATATKLGVQANVVEVQPRLLTRAVPSALSDYLAKLHSEAGVAIHLETSVADIGSEGKRLTSLTLSNGKTLNPDTVLLCIGDLPEVTLAQTAGADIQASGIFVDQHQRTSLPDTFAIGDCASFRLPASDAVIRLPSIQNAGDQGRATAAAITGKPTAYDPVPWFWSDQFDTKLQMAGLSQPGTKLVLRGGSDGESFSVLELVGHKLTAVYSVNAPSDHIAGRRLIAKGIDLDVDLACDPSVSLRDSGLNGDVGKKP